MAFRDVGRESLKVTAIYYVVAQRDLTLPGMQLIRLHNRRTDLVHRVGEEDLQ